MGQKVNPHGLRVGIIKDWDSRWYAEADVYKRQLWGWIQVRKLHFPLMEKMKKLQ